LQPIMIPDLDYIYQTFMRGDLHPLYVDLYPALLRYAVKLTGESLAHMSEDCVQDAILHTYFHREKLESMAHWRNCLFLNIRNRAIDLIRRADCNQAFVDNALLSDDAVEDVSLAIIYQDALDVIYAAVDSLPEEQRRLFDLSFREGLKNAEIADKMCLAEITVKKRKARLLEKIRQMLGRDIDRDTLLVILTLYLRQAA
ncbi:MAG: sigma-70 family RNA polymerase sigma factor, partial [Muribaculaceae bacterium]|nr:sigma-70 family RNA polymerase sigma factor [Muribaculaceae bacterium]